MKRRRPKASQRPKGAGCPPQTLVEPRPGDLGALAAIPVTVERTGVVSLRDRGKRLARWGQRSGECGRMVPGVREGSGGG